MMFPIKFLLLLKIHKIVNLPSLTLTFSRLFFEVFKQFSFDISVIGLVNLYYINLMAKFIRMRLCVSVLMGRKIF